MNGSNGVDDERFKGTIVLDGESLSCEDLVKVSTGDYKVELSENAWRKIEEGRKVVTEIVESNKVVYGINTGFGNFASVTISKQDLSTLQKNLIRSHCAGVGEPLPLHRARMLLCLRINVLAKGYSGIRPETVRKLIAALNKSCISYVPERGTVGASGDLAPLAHMALGMMGEGKMWNPSTEKWEDAASVLAEHGLEPIDLEAKEGLALINGTQFISSLGAEALSRAHLIALQADIVAALTLEALRGSHKAFDQRIHQARPHSGQQEVAKRFRHLLLENYKAGSNANSNGETTTVSASEIAASHANCKKVQDSYTLRCIPQVHGIVHDTIKFVRGILETELNSGTDNPMVFADESLDSGIPGFKDKIVSGGNFHGEYPAKALDYLAIGIHELANISERRIERLCNTELNDGLPPFLVKEGGLNSGFMIAHCTAAALTSENKVYVHPSSSDTLSTSAAKEDHVSMGGFAARKALKVVENVEQVIAIELLAACQAMEFIRPLRTTTALEQVYNLVRTVVKPFDKDRYLTSDIEAVHRLLKDGLVYKAVEQYL